jgi:hypothetical protein
MTANILHILEVLIKVTILQHISPFFRSPFSLCPLLFAPCLGVASLLLYSFFFPNIFLIINTLYAHIYVAPKMKAGAFTALFFRATLITSFFITYDTEIQ